MTEKLQETFPPLFDTQTEIRKALQRILERISHIILTLGIIAMVLSFTRLTILGWKMNIIADLIFYVCLLLVVALRKRIPLTIAIATLIATTGIDALISFYSQGLINVGFTMLAVTCLTTGIFFGARAGVSVLIACVVCITFIGILVISGNSPAAELPSDFLSAPQNWITQIAAFTALSAISLAIIAVIMNRLKSAFGKILSQTEDLKKSEEEYRYLADNMADILFKVDMEFNIVYVSPSIEKICGYTRQELQKKNMKDLFTEESLTRAKDSFFRYAGEALHKKIDIPLMEYEYVRKDGSTFWGEVKGNFVYDDKGELRGAQGMIRDISDRKHITKEKSELERKLHQSEKLQAIGQLAGGVAHDFNNQLTGIVGFANLLKHSYSQDTKIVEYADNILTPCRRANDLTDKLLAFARDGAFKLEPVDIHTILDEVITMLKRSIDKTIRIVCNYDIKEARVLGDASQLQNAFLNLALNARDAMPLGGQITFLTHAVYSERKKSGEQGSHNRSHDYLEITIADTGVGIDEKIRNHIFEPFFSTKEKGHGYGMGLPAVYGTIKSHNGSIDFTSQKNTGTSFTIRLPLCKNISTARQAIKQEQLHLGTGNILVIDDEESVRKMITVALNNLGYSVTAFDDAFSAIDYYRESKDQIDCVLLDLILPDIHGNEVLKELKREREDIKIIFMSGYNPDDSAHTLLEEKPTHFLKKPFTTLELSHTIAGLLDNN